ncbi:hypothetical protein O9G_002707 [Rozella allomycis CSF55]|uniref:Uncharacterized protein n=1 Tax=Rozella allomycis (strain CSF55) TaxID=988480 RepID=A0A075AQT7_ROZAC|nr:hypothetical protein O9G_002707 [Rozella allomycis CSF55]|eukprot:EPZ32621.1 hypothetical protein O9G_002707 [Rozella allomycis CSF55]
MPPQNSKRSSLPSRLDSIISDHFEHSFPKTQLHSLISKNNFDGAVKFLEIKKLDLAISSVPFCVHAIKTCATFAFSRCSEDAKIEALKIAAKDHLWNNVLTVLGNNIDPFHQVSPGKVFHLFQPHLHIIKARNFSLYKLLKGMQIEDIIMSKSNNIEALDSLDIEVSIQPGLFNVHEFLGNDIMDAVFANKYIRTWLLKDFKNTVSSKKLLSREKSTYLVYDLKLTKLENEIDTANLRIILEHVVPYELDLLQDCLFNTDDRPKKIDRVNKLVAFYQLKELRLYEGVKIENLLNVSKMAKESGLHELVSYLKQINMDKNKINVSLQNFLQAIKRNNNSVKSALMNRFGSQIKTRKFDVHIPEALKEEEESDSECVVSLPSSFCPSTRNIDENDESDFEFIN